MSKFSKNGLLMMVSMILLFSCTESNKQTTDETVNNSSAKVVSTKTEDVKELAFSDLFTAIKETEINENVFKLVGSDYTVITAGDESSFNSMVASYGGWGILFENPVTWCFLRANRYTLEIMRKENTYTMTYFEEIHKEEYIKFGMSSGRNTEKMKETQLTPVQTPSGNITYKEAKLIIECTLAQITTVAPDDFLTEKGKNFVIEGYEDAKEYHKLVFGNITNVWVRK